MADDRRVYAIICAAGKGTRMGASVPKQFLKLGSRTILETAAEVFACSPVVDEVVIVTAAEYEDACRAMFSGEEKKISIVTGGRERQDSIFRALEFLKAEGAGRDDTVLIHDGVRPYVSANLVSEAVKIIESGEDAAVPAIAVTDTIRDTDGTTLDRNRLRRVQTPQAFRFGAVLDAYEKADADGYYGTDDGGLAERAGYRVVMFPGEEKNIKITVKEDLDMENRIGTGFDVHAFSEERRLILGGVHVPFDKGLAGHSDADVLVHALMDAMLGAAALGDIGKAFPDSDDSFKDISSLKLLEEVRDMIGKAGYRLVNADMTVICQRPKLAPYIDEMRKNIADVLGVEPGRISVKATTTEKLGFTGRGEGIAAEAVCLLETTI